MTHHVVRWMDSNIDKVAEHLPEGWSFAQARRSAMALLQQDKQNGGKISQCEPGSLTLAILQCASYGLQLDTSDAYIIPYGKEATLHIGWQGLVKLAKRGGDVRHIEAELVYEGEKCVISRSSDKSRHGIVHDLSLTRGGSVVGAYALITLADGSETFEYCSKEDIEAARSQSKAKNSPAWSKFYGEMAKKVVIRRALKRYALSAEAQHAMAEDDRRHVVAEIVTGSGLSTAQLNQRLLNSEMPAPQAPDSPVDFDPSSEDAGDVREGGDQ